MYIDIIVILILLFIMVLVSIFEFTNTVFCYLEFKEYFAINLKISLLLLTLDIILVTCVFWFFSCEVQYKAEFKNVPVVDFANKQYLVVDYNSKKIIFDLTKNTSLVFDKNQKFTFKIKSNLYGIFSCQLDNDISPLTGKFDIIAQPLTEKPDNSLQKN